MGFFEGFADEIVKLAAGKLTVSKEGTKPTGVFATEQGAKVSGDKPGAKWKDLKFKGPKKYPGPPPSYSKKEDVGTPRDFLRATGMKQWR